MNHVVYTPNSFKEISYSISTIEMYLRFLYGKRMPAVQEFRLGCLFTIHQHYVNIHLVTNNKKYRNTKEGEYDSPTF